ncbi:unnamed protein product [Cladocopium goreaui]|nr:unnamed protein product [Cladocopium goreaui]
MKQLQAAQRFLSGIRELATYANFVEKQAAGVKKSLEKMPAVSPGEAAGLLGAIDPQVWSPSHVEGFRLLLASKTKAVVADNVRTTQQDFATLPFFLTEELCQKILGEGTDRDQLLFDVCAHAAKLTLRVATEGSKATIIALAYWTQLCQGMTAKEKYNLYLQKKPVVTKYLSVPPSSTTILELPVSWKDLPSEVAQSVFPTGKPMERKEFAADVMQFVRNMPLRKDHKLLQGEADIAAGSVSSGSASSGLSVDAICKVVEACSRGMQNAGTQQVLSLSSPVTCPVPAQKELLAIEDGLVEEKTPTGCLPKKSVQDEQKDPEMSVEQQLEALQGNARLLEEAALKRPASKKGLKRPAAANGTVAYAAICAAEGSTGSLQGGTGRGRPIKSSLLRGRKAPAPLRSDLQPDGLDNLEGLDKLKTELANQLYEGITKLILFAAGLDICVVVENPTNSLYWKTSFAQKFLTILGGYMTDFHNCCHGGSRDKLTSFWSNKDWMQPLQMFCDGQHQHQSWRPKIRDGRLVFPTAEEAAYPWLLCARIINLVLDMAQRFGAVMHVDISKDQTVECHHVGVPHDPMAFLEKAIDAGHPKDLERHVDPTMHEVLMDNFHRPPHLLAGRRIDFIKKYTQLATTSKAEELKLRLKMPPHIRKLMKGKRLHLLGVMLADLGFPDKDLLHGLCNGFKLSGWMPDSNLFPRKVRNPTLTVDALKQSSNSFNEKVMQQMSIRQEGVLEQDTWGETEHEIEQDWIWEDTTSDWTGKSVARRFGIRQGGKTRVIDDCTVCGLNLTVGTKEKFALQLINYVECWTIASSARKGNTAKYL